MGTAQAEVPIIELTERSLLYWIEEVSDAVFHVPVLSCYHIMSCHVISCYVMSCYYVMSSKEVPDAVFRTFRAIIDNCAM